MRALIPALGLLLAVSLRAADADFDVVIANGRVIDPESKLDAVRHVGIRGGAIRALSTQPLRGRTMIEAKGAVVSPGFIDLHQHATNPEDAVLKVQDGVTLIAELEVGTADVDAWYAAREGKLPIHFAVSVGHIPCRMLVMGDQPAFLPAANSGAALKVANEAQLAQLRDLIERGLQQGAVAVGFGLQYTPGATHWEAMEMFRVAGRFKASCHVHLRAKGLTGPGNVFSSVQELIAASLITGAPAHICHVQATSNQFTPQVFQLIGEARARGIDISSECYPYTAGMTDIRSAIFDPGWERDGRYTFKDIQWPATGERLTAETFAQYRKIGGLVIFHSNTEDVVRAAVLQPFTLFASDGLRGHPRHAGTSARVLGRYVREQKLLTLSQAIEKLSLLPAQRLEQRVPAMKNKGRIRIGADADLVVFDPEKIIDRATYENAELSSAGIHYVLVAGAIAVKEGVFQDGVKAGRGVRAPRQK